MATKPFTVDGNIVVDEATLSNSTTSLVLPAGSTITGGGAVLDATNSDTDDLTEGVTNLYFTDARADARIALQAGANLDLSGKSTTDLSEGTNLYYTQGRFDTAFTAKSTTDLAEGTNLYYTDTRADARIVLQAGANLDLSSKSTTDLAEGTNLYYTDTRADARIAAASITDLSDADQSVQTTDNVTFANITATGYIAGPATFTIDPAAVGDATGTVVILGDLQVDGTTTTINSTTLDVDDLNITVASGAANAAAANGAGLTVDGASATLTYDSANDRWAMNKSLDVTGTITADGLTVDGTAVEVVSINSTQNGAQINFDSASTTNDWSIGISNSADGDFLIYQNAAAGAGDLRLYTNGQERLTILSGGNVGIGHTSPDEVLDVKGNFTLRDTTGNLAHGMSVFGDDDQYAIFNQESSGDGGLRITTLSDAATATSAFQINAVATTPSTDGNNAVIRLRAAKKNGTTEQALASTEDVLSIGNTGTELVIVKGNGRVGIGTTSPAGNLSILSNNPNIRFDDSDTSNNGEITLDNTSLRIESDPDNAVANSTIKFNVDNDTRMIVLSSGNVGIGDTNPAEKFTIKGDGARMTISSNDYEVAMLGRRGSTAPNWDRGYLRLKYDGNNTIVLDTGGDSYFNGGDVGIGTATPGYSLHIQRDKDQFIAKIENDGNNPGTSGNAYADASDGLWVDTRWNTATNTPFKVTSNSGTADLMIIKGNGNIGIGTASPSDKLEVSRTSTDQTVGLTLTNLQAGGYGSGIVWKSKRSDAPNNILDAAKIVVTGENSWNGDGNTASQMQFWTQKDNTLTKHMTLNKNGNLSIGTASPEVKLEVNGGADGSVVFGGRSDGGNGNNRRFNLIAFADGGGANYGGGLKIQTRDSVNVFHDRITVLSNGNVGIGTTNPGVKLDVAGEIASRASSPGLYLYDSNVTNLYHRIIGGGNAGLEYSADLNNVGAGYHRWDIGPNTRMYLTEAGNLGIGTTSPAGYFHIAGNGTTNDRMFNISTTGVGGGQNGVFYGGKVQVQANNSAIENFGWHVFTEHAGIYSPTTSIHGEAKTGSSNVRVLGVHGIADSNSAAVNYGPNTANAAGVAAGVYAEAKTYGSTNNATISALIAQNRSSAANTAYGAWINTTPGPNSIIPLSVNHNGTEKFTVNALADAMVHVKGDPADTGTTGGSDGLSIAYDGGRSCPIYFGAETDSAQKSMYMTGYWIYLRGHQNEGIRFVFSQGAGSAPRSDQYQFKYNSATRPTGNTTWDGFSDVRAKENVQNITGALDTISQLRPVVFDWTDDYADTMNMFKMDETDPKSYNWTSVKENGYDLDRKTSQIGFIAQEFETVFPKSITEQELELGDTTIEDFKTVNYDHLIPTLTKAIQELKAENDALKARLDAAGL